MGQKLDCMEPLTSALLMFVVHTSQLSLCMHAYGLQYYVHESLALMCALLMYITIVSLQEVIPSIIKQHTWICWVVHVLYNVIISLKVLPTASMGS